MTCRYDKAAERHLLHLLLDVICDIPRALPIALNRWLMGQHRGEYLDAEIGWVCMSPTHRGVPSWPCADYKMAADRITDIERRFA